MAQTLLNEWNKYNLLLDEDLVLDVVLHVEVLWEREEKGEGTEEHREDAEDSCRVARFRSLSGLVAARPR